MIIDYPSRLAGLKIWQDFRRQLASLPEDHDQVKAAIKVADGRIAALQRTKRDAE